ncbi:hypothetical protein [Microvirga antarctica]|uniref:hypothetical protein n=1 Tax=Microvirga antarctica TaxID=2819233 RepID=UPI001B314DAB|nr:hypothetical protein [Microvirga antarctica]
MTRSIDTLTDQLLAVVEIVSAQNRELEALKQRCDRLENNEQAVMVALTTLFHILSASQVSDLDSMANVLGDIITQAEALDLPVESVASLRSIETMIRAQHGTVSAASNEGSLSAQET